MQESQYRIGDPIGSGGMSNVFMGFDEKLHRKVAIKVLLQKYQGNQKMKDLFLKEGRNMAAVQHPYVLQIITIEENRELPWLIMEYADGGPLTNESARGPMPPPKAIEIFENLLNGLEEIHKEMIHRDLKPDNILSVNGKYKIADFGIATSVGTKETAKFMSQPYAAPEIVLGDNNVTKSADIYSLGLVIYELLLGSEEYQRMSQKHMRRVINWDALEMGYGQWYKWHESPEALPPPHTIDPAIPEDLSTIIHRMIAKDPQERFPNCNEILDTLADVGSASDDDTQTDIPRPEKEKVWTRKNQLLAATVVLMFLAIGALFVFKARQGIAVEVNSTPSGAEVWVNERNLGKTPLDPPMRFKVGRTLIFKLDGYSEVSETITEETTALSPVLQPLAVAMTVHSTPSGATLFLEDKKLDQTPTTETPLKPGVEITFKRPGFKNAIWHVPHNAGEYHQLLEPSSEGMKLAQEFLKSPLWGARKLQLEVLGASPVSQAPWVQMSVGSDLHFKLESEMSGHVYILYLSNDGSASLIYDGTIRIDSEQSREFGREKRLYINEPGGHDWLFALVSDKPLAELDIESQTPGLGIRIYPSGPSANALVEWLLRATPEGEAAITGIEIKII